MDSRVASCALGLFLFGSALACDVPPPPGEQGVQFRARYFHDLEGPLLGNVVAEGARFLMACSLDDCDPLEETCGLDDRLELRGVPASVLDVQVRADGLFGVRAAAPGFALLQAVDGEGKVVDLLPVEVVRVARVALSDQPPGAVGARALPLDFGVAAEEDVELRFVLADAEGRVALHGDDDRFVTTDLREGDALLDPSANALGAHVRLRPEAWNERARYVIGVSDGTIEDSSQRIFVAPPTGDGRLLVDLHHVRTEPGFGIVSIDMCAVRDFDGAFQTGHGFRWTAPSSFVVKDLGLGAFEDDPPEGSRCVRASRYEDRDLSNSEQFIVERGSARAVLPFGLVQGRVREVKPWFWQAWEYSQAVVFGERPIPFLGD